MFETFIHYWNISLAFRLVIILLGAIVSIILPILAVLVVIGLVKGLLAVALAAGVAVLVDFSIRKLISIIGD